MLVHSLSLDVIEAVLSNPGLKGWDGFGVVVQAYSKRCPKVLEWLYELTRELKCKISVRLVKGAYWDAEIKNAQILGIEGYPVFTRKEIKGCIQLYNYTTILKGSIDVIKPSLRKRTDNWMHINVKIKQR